MFTIVKAHVERNKKKYIVGSYVAVAGVSVLVTRSFVLNRLIVTPEGVKVVVRPIAILAKQTIYNIIHLDRQGPLSWVVRCSETGEEFLSQRAAGLAKGISAKDLSQHLNYGTDLINGLHFERIGLAG